MVAGVKMARLVDIGVIVVEDSRSLRRSLAVRQGSRGLVMITGELHEGHLSLVREAKRHADHVVVALLADPRDMDADLAALSGVGADVVYAPGPADHPAEPRTRLDPGPIAGVLEGAARPAHFSEVATVVARMLNVVRPDVAVLGQKDAQELAVVRRLVADLDMGVRIIAAPIFREPDGLARSSRNIHLLGDERVHARALSRALRAGAVAAYEGAGARGVVAAARTVLEAEEGVEVDYVALVDPATFEPLTRRAEPALLVVAATVGPTRLIDNAAVSWG